MTTIDTREIELLDGTIADLTQGLAELMEHRAALDVEIRAKQERLRTWQSRRAKLGGFEGAPRVRRAKGENERLIAALFSHPDVPAAGLSLREIEKRTGLPASSVHAAVTRKGTFVEVGGLWRPSQNGAHAQEAAPTTTS